MVGYNGARTVYQYTNLPALQKNPGVGLFTKYIPEFLSIDVLLTIPTDYVFHFVLVNCHKLVRFAQLVRGPGERLDVKI